MASVAQIQAKANSRINGILPGINSLQASYLTAHGRYWQGIRTPVAIPVDGADVAPNLSLKPTDQLESWQDFFQGSLTGMISFSIAVDTHNGPDGKGYTIELRLTSAQVVTYRRLIGMGPHSENQDWIELPSGSA